MSLLSRLFGGGGSGSSDQPSEAHEGFTITPTPIREGPTYRLSARIEKTVNGEPKSHTLIRADTFQDEDAAAQAAVTKARMLIDEQGEALFG